MSDAPSKPATVLYLHETVAQSWLRDIGSFAVAFSLMGVGHLMGSSAMEWFGFVTASITLISWAQSQSCRMTPQQAADRLAEDFGVHATPPTQDAAA